jgi:radical SAM protein with 4Fe4S-binding SPASM domain
MSKKLLQKNFCAIPWTGFELEPNGNIKNCIISNDVIGNIKNQDIQTIINKNPLRQEMLDGKYPSNCSGCYLQEKHRGNKLDSISSRIYYAKELANSITPGLLEDKDNFELRHVDIRWSNACNLACVYCDPKYSSKWATELGEPVKQNKDSIAKLKDYIYSNVKTLKNVYLAGGEPLLMKDNKEFLQLLLKENPDVTLRINTNLSKTGTGVFDEILKFKNVHWTISVESIEKEFEYIRYHGNWKDFCENLETIKLTGHRVSFNMLYFILNHESIFSTVEYFQDLGYHNNQFVIGPLFKPLSLNVLNLPKPVLDRAKKNLQDAIDKKPGFLLQNSWENCLSHLTDTKFYANIDSTKERLKQMDIRRNIDSEKIFPKLYSEVLN